MGEGFQNGGSCCGAVVFVDQSAESVAALDFSGFWPCVGVRRVGCEQREYAEYGFEVAAADAQQPVETFGADGANEA
jgi:hypothetical protein